MSDRLLLSRHEAAHSLGISLRTIDYLIAGKEIRTIRVGRRRLIPQTELARFLRHDHLARTEEPAASQS